MSITRPPRITVVGRGRCSEELASLAADVGAEIARRGAILVCGGLGGVMEAASRGALEADGMTIGVLPGTDPERANPYIVVPIPTGMGEARNVINVRAGRAVIALDGGNGTLSEIALALKIGIPVVALGAWSELDGVVAAGDASEAVDEALRLAGGD
ncbi:MAG: TIGR00725 family protein [Candidatus Eisenbacteria bacterium]|nr:TIGR00725 family protein [Candidatus Eisenbacteria bacterium]